MSRIFSRLFAAMIVFLVLAYLALAVAGAFRMITTSPESSAQEDQL